jgi:hypothetical protein
MLFYTNSVLTLPFRCVDCQEKIIFSTNSCRERVTGMGILKFEVEQIEDKVFVEKTL